MPIVVEPESGIPFPFDTTPEEIEQFRERAKAAVETIKEIIALGGEIEIDEDDRTTARRAVTSNQTIKINESNAGALVHLEAILSEYDQELLNASTRLRNYVTNKLLFDTANEDAKVRLRALELLGKVSTVGLFSDKLEIEVKQRKVEDVDAELGALLEKYLGNVVEIDNSDDELDQVVKERSLLEMSEAEIGLPDPTHAENTIDPAKLERIEDGEIVTDFDD
jgi:hypothetical protein